jgi:rubrerythrin
MKTYDFNFQLGDIHNRRNHKLDRILNKRFKSTGIAPSAKAHWNAQSFGLENIELYQNLKAKEKDLLLKELSMDRIQEAYHIEKSGIAYGSKMTFLSETMDERVLYGSFTGDEARHFKLIEKYYDHSLNSDITDNCFLNFLSQMIEKAPKRSLVFMIQILLEGWGLDHYSTMANECQTQELKTDLKSILDDEVVHHGSGVILFEENELTKDERKIVMSSLASFFQMVQVGPISIMTRLESMGAELSKENRILALNQMNAYEGTVYKLNVLKRLMKKSGAKGIIEELDHLGHLQAFSTEQMAACF